MKPVIEPPFLSPIIADPTFLPPDESPDKKWHLFAHSIFGLHHYLSDDGVNWDKGRLIKRFAIRPFVYKEGDFYYLFFEQIKFIIPRTTIQFSEIQVMKSTDLVNWSKPKTVLRPNKDWHGTTVSNFCILKLGKKYLLYYGANLRYIWECLYPEPKFRAIAESKEIDGNFTDLIEIGNQVYQPFRVFKDKNGFYGFEAEWYKDERKRDRSRIWFFKSDDGMNWKKSEKPLIESGGQWWKRSFVYVCDGKRVGNKMYIYFNARDGWAFAKERIILKII